MRIQIRDEWLRYKNCNNFNMMQSLRARLVRITIAKMSVPDSLKKMTKFVYSRRNVNLTLISLSQNTLDKVNLSRMCCFYCDKSFL